MAVKPLELFCSSLKSEPFLTLSLININEEDENILISYPVLYSYSRQICILFLPVCVCASFHSIRDLFKKQVMSTYVYNWTRSTDISEQDCCGVSKINKTEKHDISRFFLDIL